jgi:hypothetical protein
MTVFEKVNKINSVLYDIEYGWMDCESNVYFKVNENFSEMYKLQAPETTKKKKLGICWDVVELQRKLYTELSIDVFTFFIVYYNNFDCPAHTFIVFKLEDKYYWHEYSWEKYRGLHEYNDLNSLISDLKNKFIDSELNLTNIELNNLCIFKYGEPAFNISCLDFYKHCESGKPILL